MWSRKSKTADSAVDSLVLSVTGMHCGNCGLTIDDAVEDVPGVIRATTSFRTGLTEVVLADGADAGAVAPQVVKAIAGIGYGAAVRVDAGS